MNPDMLPMAMFGDLFEHRLVHGEASKVGGVALTQEKTYGRSNFSSFMDLQIWNMDLAESRLLA